MVESQHVQPDRLCMAKRVKYGPMGDFVSTRAITAGYVGRDDNLVHSAEIAVSTTDEDSAALVRPTCLGGLFENSTVIVR